MLWHVEKELDDFLQKAWKKKKKLEVCCRHDHAIQEGFSMLEMFVSKRA